MKIRMKSADEKLSMKEAFQYHIRQMIGTAKPDRRFCAGEHIEHLGLMGIQIDLSERLPALSWLWIDCDMLHSAHAEVAEFLQVF